MLGNQRWSDKKSGNLANQKKAFMSKGKPSAETAILSLLKEAEKPLVSCDFGMQKDSFQKIWKQIEPLKLKSLDELNFDCRTRLFTALLRAGRQKPSSDPEKEEQRKAVLGLLGDIWSSVGDERRAGLLLAAAGRTEPAAQLLQSSGEWQEAALLHQKEGRYQEAGKIYERNGDWRLAFEAYRQGKDNRRWLRAALRAKDIDESRKAARFLSNRDARNLFKKYRQDDLYLELLACRKEWMEIGRLYESAEQWRDAAAAYEHGGRLVNAVFAWKKAAEKEKDNAELATECLRKALELENRVAEVKSD